MSTFSERLARLQARDDAIVADKCRTAAHVHGEKRPRAIVLLHGMSASPPQFERFAKALHGRGHNVLVPRLPRHGHADRLSTALGRLHPEELYASAREYVAIARELGDRVTVAGFSLGGLIAAWIAQHHDVERAVAIAPFFGVAWLPGAVMGGAAELALRLPNRFPWWDPIARERQMPDHGYPRYATHAVAHAFRMGAHVLRESIDRGPAAERVVLVLNAREATVNNRAIKRLYRRWSKHRPGAVELVVLEGLRPSHDVVEPLRHADLAKRAFPTLLQAIDPE